MNPISTQHARKQLPLFHEGLTLTELAVDALVRGEPELQAIARDLITLVRYHAARVPGEVHS